MNPDRQLNNDARAQRVASRAIKKEQKDQSDFDHPTETIEMADNPPPAGAAGPIGQQLAEMMAAIQALQAENALLRQGTPRTREGTAFGRPGEFQATGLAARPEFQALGEDHVYNEGQRAHTPDPAPFDNVEVRFESWVVELASKFGNDDATFRNEAMRIHYAARYVKGTPKKAIEPRLRSTTRPFTCVAELIQVLQTAFRDANLAARARRELSTLKYDWKVSIGEFIAHYNALAEDAGIDINLLKQTLWETLPAPLNLNTIDAAQDPDVSYEKLCDKITRLAYVAEQNFKTRKTAEGPAKAKTRTATTTATMSTTSTTATAMARPPNTRGRFTKLTDAERNELWARGACFRCRQDGHMADQCPNGGRGETPKVATLVPRSAEEDTSPDEAEESGKE
jgi:hypothetical protein